jgi:hypothetical protein
LPIRGVLEIQAIGLRALDTSVFPSNKPCLAGFSLFSVDVISPSSTIAFNQRLFGVARVRITSKHLVSIIWRHSPSVKTPESKVLVPHCLRDFFVKCLFITERWISVL